LAGVAGVVDGEAIDGGVFAGDVADGPTAAAWPLGPDGLSAGAVVDWPVAAAIPRAGPVADDWGARLERLGVGGTVWGCAVLAGALHGTRRNKLRGRSLPNQPATDGPTRSTITRAMPTPNAMRNQRTLKMLGCRRIRCDTSDLTRLMLEFPKYDRMLAGQC
jgi:hypothetical protein